MIFRALRFKLKNLWTAHSELLIETMANPSANMLNNVNPFWSFHSKRGIGRHFSFSVSIQTFPICSCPHLYYQFTSSCCFCISTSFCYNRVSTDCLHVLIQIPEKYFNYINFFTHPCMMEVIHKYSNFPIMKRIKNVFFNFLKIKINQSFFSLFSMYVDSDINLLSVVIHLDVLLWFWAWELSSLVDLTVLHMSS